MFILDRGSNPGGGEIFSTCPDRPWGPPNLLYNGYRVFPWGKVRPGRELTPHSLLVPRSKIELSYTSTLPKGLRGLWKGEIYVPHFWPIYSTHKKTKEKFLFVRELVTLTFEMYMGPIMKPTAIFRLIWSSQHLLTWFLEGLMMVM